MQLRSPIATERNYGIDLLRLISMLYVLVLHSLGGGGVLDHTARLSAQYRFGWFMQMWALCAVDIFALISGYVGYSEQPKKFNYANYLVMWLQVVTYGVGLSLLFYWINPEWVTGQQLMRMFFPVSNQLFWYFNGYTGLFFVIPLINAAVRQGSREDLCRTALGCVLFVSAFEMITGALHFERGYSAVWLVILYFLGATIKKYDIGRHLSIPAAFAGIVICCILSWLWRMYGKSFTLFGSIFVTREQVCSYVTPTHVCAAVFHVILFTKLKFGRGMKKIISFAAPGAFAVYLLNTQTHVWDYFMAGRFLYLAEAPVHVIFVHILLFSLVFLITAILIDYVRQNLFALFRVKQIANYITEQIGRLLGWCTNKIMR